MTDQQTPPPPPVPEPSEDEKMGRLTPAQIDLAVAWLQAKWGANTPCPVHQGPTNWDINPFLGQLPGFSRAGFMSISGRSFPAVIVTCGVCGFMVPINAIRAGVLPADPPEVHEQAGEVE